MRTTAPSRRRLRRIAATAAVVLLTTLASCSTGHDMSGMDHAASPTADAEASAPTAATGTPAAGPHSATDVMFAQMMIPHHRQAIEMSQVIMGKSGVPVDVVRLAEQISAAQQPEIARMSGWLAGWGQDPSPTMIMDHGADGGMMSESELTALRRADGTRAAELFLAGMIKHHEGAVAMARDQLADGQNPEAKTLARDVIDSQQAEISTMQRLLAQL